MSDAPREVGVEIFWASLPPSKQLQVPSFSTRCPFANLGGLGLKLQAPDKGNENLEPSFEMTRYFLDEPIYRSRSKNSLIVSIGSGLVQHKICNNLGLKCGVSYPSILEEVYPPLTFLILGMGLHQDRSFTETVLGLYEKGEAMVRRTFLLAPTFFTISNDLCTLRDAPNGSKEPGETLSGDNLTKGISS
ncbi:hypothetical protein JHK84_045267 [Glycine max]|nr:hypothetical protein JHK84_045267 [Glycine max]